MAIVGGTGIIYITQDPTTEGLVPNEAQSNFAEWAWDSVNFNLYYWNRTTDAWVLYNPASSFTLAGDGGANQTITDGDTMTISGGALLASTGAATDTLTLDWDPAALTAGDVLYSDGTTMQTLAVGTAGQVLAVNAGATAPEWITPFSSFTVQGQNQAGTAQGVDQTINEANTLIFKPNAATDNIFTFTGINTDTMGFGWATAPTTGGNTEQVLIFDDATDTYSWGAPIVIAAGSAPYMSFDATTRELSVSNLLVTDVTVDTVQTSITAYVATTPTHEEGDVVILTAATGGTEVYIHNGGAAGTIADYTLINDATAMTSLTLAADSGTSETLLNGDTITISAGALMATTVAATDTVTIDWDAASLTAGDILYSNGTTMLTLPAGTAGQRLAMNAGATAPEWVNDTPTLSEFASDAAAGVGGVAVGEDYILSATNLYGLPQGLHKRRIS